MLRGGTTQGWEYLALVAITVVTVGAAWFLLRRSMLRA
jgi:hypothetical protein